MGERQFNDWWIDDETLATIEPAAGRIESQVAPLIDRVRQEKRLEGTGAEIGDLALLLAFQFVRTKKMRLLLERMDRQLREAVERMGFDQKRIKNLPEINDDELKRFHVRQQIEGLPQYTELMAEKVMFLMEPPEGRTFYIGDHPVVMHTDHPKVARRRALGLGVPFIQIFLPLSSDLMLCAFDKAVLGDLMMGSDQERSRCAAEALQALRAGKISAHQMARLLRDVKAADPVVEMMDAIRSGRPVQAEPEHVQFYNSLQSFNAHRFVVDPDGVFEVAKEMRDEWAAGKSR